MAAMAHSLPAAELSIAIDDSDHHVEGVLQQQVQGACQPLAFFSKKLNVVESR